MSLLIGGKCQLSLWSMMNSSQHSSSSIGISSDYSSSLGSSNYSLMIKSSISIDVFDQISTFWSIVPFDILLSLTQFSIIIRCIGYFVLFSEYQLPSLNVLFIGFSLLIQFSQISFPLGLQFSVN